MSTGQPWLPGLTAGVVAFRKFNRRMEIRLERLVAIYRRVGNSVALPQVNTLIPKELEESVILHGTKCSLPRLSLRSSTQRPPTGHEFLETGTRKTLLLKAGQIVGLAHTLISRAEKQAKRKPSKSYTFDWDENTFDVWGSNGFHMFAIKENHDSPAETAAIEGFISWLNSLKVMEN